MKLNTTQIWLIVGVLATAIVITFPPAGGEVEPAKKVDESQNKLPESISFQDTQNQPPPHLEHIELERLNEQKIQTGDSKTISNAFKTTSWYVAPPPTPQPPPPPPPVAPAPVAPPVPFIYFGRYEDTSKRLVILAMGTKLYTVSEGDVIDGNYRVERISDKTVDLVYLPLNTNQSISTIGAQDNSQHRPGAEELTRRQ